MNDSLDPLARSALTKSLRAKVANLVAEQDQLAEQRAAVLAQQRRNDRELADCRATARLFNLDIDIPVPDRELMSQREREMVEMARSRELDAERLRRAAARAVEAVQEVTGRGSASLSELARAVDRVSGSVTAATQFPSPPVVPVPATQQTSATRRPSLKDFLLDRLRAAGADGAKAAPLREAFERAFGETIHEKTVGMTLYRMSKDNLVKRDGHTWFIADPPSGGEAVNPGADTPGPDNRLI